MCICIMTSLLHFLILRIISGILFGEIKKWNKRFYNINMTQLTFLFDNILIIKVMFTLRTVNEGPERDRGIALLLP